MTDEQKMHEAFEDWYNRPINILKPESATEMEQYTAFQAGAAYQAAETEKLRRMLAVCEASLEQALARLDGEG